MLRKITTIILIVLASPSFARWANIADAPIEMISNAQQINVKADGSFTIEVTKQIKILNERGREAHAKAAVTYNHDDSTLEIITAKTINGEQEFPLNQNLIEDKPLASEMHGFDQTHQVLLAFPNVNVGSTLYLQYKLHVYKPDIPGFFEYMQEFVEMYIKQSTLKITSELPLYINTNDPLHYLDIKQGQKGNTYTLDIKLQKPIFIAIIDEKHDLINPTKYPWVFVNTSDSWPSFAQKYSDPYITVLQQPLPPMYQSITNAAKQEKDPLKQISLVAAGLNENVQYMGDWKTTNGRHVPQALQDVANKRLGDCKDFATGLVAILQHLGFKANVVLVQRGMGVYDTKMIKLPGGIHFNHAIARVEANNKVYWVDPTNFFSIADKILPDIADRQAIVLASNNSSYVAEIPQSTPQDNIILSNKNFDLKNPDLVSVQAVVTLRGLAAINLTGANLQVAQETIDNAIVNEMGNFENIIDKKVVAPKLNSRIVNDITFAVDFKEKNMLLNTNAGKSLMIENPVIDNFIFGPEQVSDVYLGAPKTIQRTATLQNINISSTDVLDYTLQSPWVDVIRTVQYKQNLVTVQQKIIIKTSWLYNDTIQTPQYQSFAAELAKNFKDGIGIVFNN